MVAPVQDIRPKMRLTELQARELREDLLGVYRLAENVLSQESQGNSLASFVENYSVAPVTWYIAFLRITSLQLVTRLKQNLRVNLVLVEEFI